MAKVVIGLDISSDIWTSVIVSRASRDRARIEGVLRFPRLPFSPSELFELEHEDEAFMDELLKWADVVKEQLGAHCAQGASLVVGIPRSLVSLRVTEVPFTQESKIQRVLPFEVESSLPFDVEDLLFDFYPLLKLEDQSRVFAAAVQRDHIQALLQNLKVFDFDPVMVTPSTIGFHHLLSLPESGISDEEGRVAFLDIGERYSRLGVIEGGKTVCALNLMADRSGFEELAEEGGEDRSPRLLGGIRRAIHFLEGYAPLDGGCPPPTRRLILAGDGASTPGLAEKLSESFQLEVEPFRLPPEMAAEGVEIDPAKEASLAAPLALALQQLSGSERTSINFRKAEFAYKPERKILVRKLLFPGFLVAALLVALILNVALTGSSDDARIKAVKSEMEAAFKQVFPGRPATDPVGQLSRIMKEYKAKEPKYRELTTPSALTALAALSGSIPGEIDLTITSYKYDETRIDFTGTVEELDDTNTIQKELAKVPVFYNVELEKATSIQSGGYRFKITIDLAEEKAK